MAHSPLRVLVLCTGNSARSQMAEGWFHALAASVVVASSAGSRPSNLHPLAVEVMAERGVDLGSQRSEHLERYLDTPFDTVITVCDNAAADCPVFPGRARRVHWSLPDPAAVSGAPEERRRAFRAVRDDLEARIRAWLVAEGYAPSRLATAGSSSSAGAANSTAGPADGARPAGSIE